jgi:type 1 glutamine amidotransferase/sugar phosphate isomerase/epimerase
MRALITGLFLLGWISVALAQDPAQGRFGGRGSGAAGPGPGRGAQQVAVEVRGPFSVRNVPPWGAVRTAAQSIVGWNIGVTLNSFPHLMFSDAAVKADALGVASVGGFSGQKVSLGVQKNLDGDLAADEQREVQKRLRALRLQMPAITVATLGAQESDSRRLFEFARTIGIQTIASECTPENLPLVEKLADEYGINVAVCGNLKNTLAAIEGHGKRIGVCGDTGAWMEAGITPPDALKEIKGRLLTINLRDKSALGKAGRPVRLGSGAGRIRDFLQQMYEMKVTPSLITVSAVGPTDPSAELSRTLADLEKVMQPVTAQRVAELWNSIPIKGADRLTPEQRQKVEEALPPAAAAKPKKPRKLLVVDANVGYGGARGGHATIPAANLSIELMGRRTGAWETVLSNDIGNFRYENLKQFDAVFLNNTVGMLFEDSEVRAALIRFIREGGGLAAYHGASHASLDWPEFTEMLGVSEENSRTEIESPKLDDANDPLRPWQPASSNEVLTVKIDDPKSPLTVPFAGKEFVQNDELYRFYEESYSRARLHVLLSVDVEKTDMAQGVCNRNQWEHSRSCVRADNDYAIAWIRSYGKGRVFYNAFGNDMTLFMKAPMVDHFMRAIQFVLGDLDADTTPSAKLAVQKTK